MTRIEPLQAIVNDTTGVVEQVIVCDQDTADMFAREFPDLFPGCTWHNVTDERQVGIGWTWAEDREPQFRPPQPSPDATWNDTTHTWDVPAPPAEPDPTPTPTPTDPEPTTGS